LNEFNPVSDFFVCGGVLCGHFLALQ